MTTHTLTLVAAVGLGAIALWIHVRFPGLAPQTFVAATAHVIAALALLEIVPYALRLGLASEPQLLVALFGVAFPALTYVFLASLWMIRLFQGMMSRSAR